MNQSYHFAFASMLSTILEILLSTNEKLKKRCKITKFQSSGAGGQKRNKTNSSVRISLNGYAISSECSDHREYNKNLVQAFSRLKLKVALISNHLELKLILDDLNDFEIPLHQFRKNANTNHLDFFISVFIAILLFIQNNYSYAKTAKKLSISTSAFIKFLNKDKSVKREIQKLISKQADHNTTVSNH